MKIAEKVKNTVSKKNADHILKKSDAYAKGMEFIQKMRNAGAYKCEQETLVGVTEGGLDKLKNAYSFLPKI